MLSPFRSECETVLNLEDHAGIWKETFGSCCLEARLLLHNCYRDCWLWIRIVNTTPNQRGEKQGDPKVVGKKVSNESSQQWVTGHLNDLSCWTMSLIEPTQQWKTKYSQGSAGVNPICTVDQFFFNTCLLLKVLILLEKSCKPELCTSPQLNMFLDAILDFFLLS